MSLRAEGIHFRYGGTPELLSGIDLELGPGEMTALVGPNGAGKSTLIRLFTRVLLPTSGTVTLDGVPLERLARRTLARRISVVAQSGEMPLDFLAREVVLMGRSPHLGLFGAEAATDHELVERVMRRTDTWRLAERRLGDLSGGERQRVLFARALAQTPDYLLLDEPTSQLDLRYQAELLELARREAESGIGVLLVMHDLNLAARACDRLVLLSRGSVAAAGPPAQVIDETLLAGVYGAAVHVFTEPGGAPVVLPRLGRREASLSTGDQSDS